MSAVSQGILQAGQETWQHRVFRSLLSPFFIHSAYGALRQRVSAFLSAGEAAQATWPRVSSLEGPHPLVPSLWVRTPCC